jgi:hypothetical protein
MSRLTTICRCCVTDGVPRRCFIVALVVGAILNLINQGEVLWGGARLDVAKMLLTFAVPYCVATYGAVSYRLARAQSEEEGRAANLARMSEEARKRIPVAGDGPG